MTIYVDELRQHGKKGWWCHMMSDIDQDELILFAVRLGLRSEWFQAKSHPHYDLVPSIRRKAIREGAIELSSEEMFKRCVLNRYISR